MKPVRTSRRFTLAVAAIGALALSSCATNDSREQVQNAVPIPPSWRQASSTPSPLATAALPTWWTRFNDPVLDELITDALHFSPDVNSALSRITEFRARRGIERSALFPSLDANVSGGRTRTTNRETDRSTINESYSASLDASWQVDLFGRQRQAFAAATADLAQTEENYYGAQVSLAAEVASAYVTLRSSEAQLAVVQRSLGTRSETVQLTLWREQAGMGNARDTQQSLTALELARASIPALQLTIAQTRNQLALLSGRPPGSLDPLLAAPHDVPVAPPDFAVGIPAEMLRQRPDVRAAERGLEAAYARTESARRQRLPALTLSGSIGVEALSAGSLFNPATTVVTLLGGLTAPLFDAGRIRQTIAIQRELEQQSLNVYASTVLTALSEVENALIAVQRTTERLDILTRATTAAREAASLSALQYQAGQVDLLVSLDAQRTLLDLEQQSVTTAANRASAYVQLYKALGGGWSAL
jgi:multidrug efflux system outer membrane protein